MEGSGKDVVLLCEGCGERIVLGGPHSVWNSGSTSFACGCGARLTLSHQLDPEERAEPLHRLRQRVAPESGGRTDHLSRDSYYLGDTW